MAMRMGRRRVIRAISAACVFQLVGGGAIAGGGAGPTTRCVVVSDFETASSRPNRGSVGCSWMTTKYPGPADPPPTAACVVTGNPKNDTSGTSEPPNNGMMSCAAGSGTIVAGLVEPATL